MKGVLTKAEVAGRGTGTAVRTPLEDFEAQPRDEARAFLSGVMFLTRLPCPGWCDHHPGHLIRGMAYFPIIGALIGLWQASIYEAAASIWGSMVGAALSMAGTLWLTGCFHEDGLCDTLDAFGGGWSKAQILKIMRDSRNGSYATVGGCIWVVAKIVSIARTGDRTSGSGLGHHDDTAVIAKALGMGDAGLAIIAAQCIARASAAPLVYACKYITDDEDAKGDFYNWFGDSTRLLGVTRVLFAIFSAAAVAVATLPQALAIQALVCGSVCTVIAGLYGNAFIGGVIGDFLGATICVIELAVYLAVSGDFQGADAHAWQRLGILVFIIALAIRRRS